ncbi:MAG TPA: hypothetical protein VF599_13465 [Pyrinomonadaceae bacterium]|jgi:hypothetical protein
MRIYEERTYGGEFDVDISLELYDNNRFSYSESYLSWGGGYSHEIKGTWRQSGDTVFLLVEDVGESHNPYQWEIGREQQAIVRDDSIDLGDGVGTLHLLRDKPVQAQQPKVAKAVQPDDAGQQKKQLPTVARLHFKDGTTQERPLTNQWMFGRFDQQFYRLVDENQNTTNFFKLRQNSKDFDSPVAEYDEIDFTPTVESDDFSD